MTTVLEALNLGLLAAQQADPAVVLLGEDILDPYGGAFKVTRGLSSRFPERVLSTPVSEAGIVGLATGMALRGLRPVAEIMFGDFLLLAADQLINHAAKFSQVYCDASVPLVVRTPMGGRRGYGPTHSQTLEKHFIGVPGLLVIAPCAFGDPGGLLRQTILEGQGPTLFVENKLLYLESVLPAGTNGEYLIEESGDDRSPCYRCRLTGAPDPVVTLAAYGYGASLALQALHRLAYEDEIFCELIAPTRLSPPDFTTLIASADRTGRLAVFEEGSATLGWGAEAAASAAEVLGSRLKCLRRLGAGDGIIPAAKDLEEKILPGVDSLCQMVRLMV